MTHDQNFKNLILDYPREAIAVFAAAVHLGFAPEHPAQWLERMRAHDFHCAAQNKTYQPMIR
jgi:hypothetical protein